MIMLRVRYLGAAPSALTTESVRWRLRSVARARAWPAARIWLACRWRADGEFDSDGLDGAGCSMLALAAAAPAAAAACVSAVLSVSDCGVGSWGCAAGSSRGLRDSVDPLLRTDLAADESGDPALRSSV